MKTISPLNSSLGCRLPWHAPVGLVATIAMLLCGCGSPKVVASRNGAALAGQVKKGLSICLLEPKLTYESMGDERPTDGSVLGSGQVRADLVRTAADALSAKGFRIQPAADGSLATALSTESDELLRAVKPAAILEKLKALGNALPVDTVLVQFFKIKVGPGGSWDPNTGAITAPMNSGHLRVAILDTKDGQLLWHNSVYLREIPEVGKKNYRKAIDSLYQPQTANKNN